MLGIRFYEKQAFDVWQGDFSHFACDVLILSDTEVMEAAGAPASQILRASANAPWGSFLAMETAGPCHVGISYQACGGAKEKIVATVTHLKNYCEQRSCAHLARVTFIVQSSAEYLEVQEALETHFAETPSWLS